jgi:hypothetical protein
MDCITGESRPVTGTETVGLCEQVARLFPSCNLPALTMLWDRTGAVRVARLFPSCNLPALTRLRDRTLCHRDALKVFVPFFLVSFSL